VTSLPGSLPHLFRLVSFFAPFFVSFFSPVVKTQRTGLDKTANQRSRRNGRAEAATNSIRLSQHHDHEICGSFRPLLQDESRTEGKEERNFFILGTCHASLNS